jgi:phage terminase small subunit
LSGRSLFREGFKTIILPNPRHERFAQELAKGKSATQAYADVGYSPDDSNCKRLTGNDRIMTRMAEILERAVVRTEITIELLTQEYLSTLADARVDKQHGAAKGAIDSIAKLHGHWIERSERTNRYESMTDAELEQSLARKLLRRDGGDGHSAEGRGPSRDN